MKVTRCTAEQLIVEDRPWLISALLFLFLFGTIAASVGFWIAGERFPAFIFIGFSLFIALFVALFVQRSQVILDRSTGTVTMRKRNLWRYRQVVHDLAHLDRAELEGYDTARCVLVLGHGMSAGRHPVTDYATNGPGPGRITSAINAWLDEARALDSKGTSA